MKRALIYVTAFVFLMLFFTLDTVSAEQNGFEGRNDIQYVLIYNPYIWIEGSNNKNNSLSTGNNGND